MPCWYLTKTPFWHEVHHPPMEWHSWYGCHSRWWVVYDNGFPRIWARLERAQIHRLQMFVVSSYFAIKPTRWCPSSLAKLVNISAISLGLMNGGYIYIVIGIINQRSHHWGGTTLQLYNFQNSMLQKSVMKFLRCRDAVDPSSSLGVCVYIPKSGQNWCRCRWEHICFEHWQIHFSRSGHIKRFQYILNCRPCQVSESFIKYLMLFNRTSLNK